MKIKIWKKIQYTKLSFALVCKPFIYSGYLGEREKGRVFGIWRKRSSTDRTCSVDQADGRDWPRVPHPLSSKCSEEQREGTVSCLEKTIPFLETGLTVLSQQPGTNFWVQAEFTDVCLLTGRVKVNLAEERSSWCVWVHAHNIQWVCGGHSTFRLDLSGPRTLFLVLWISVWDRLSPSCPG